MVATLIVRRPSGATRVLEADRCVVEHGLVTARGCWRSPTGRLSAPQTYTWDRRRIVEIRWR